MQLLTEFRRIGTLAPVDGTYMGLLQTDDSILAFVRPVFIHFLLLRVDLGDNIQTVP